MKKLECANDMFGNCRGEVRSCKHHEMGLCEFHHARACQDEVQVGDGPFHSLWHAQVPEGMMTVKVIQLPPDPQSALAPEDRRVAVLVPA